MARRRKLPADARIVITELAPDGIAEAEAEGGFRLRVRGALPGEDVSVRVLRRRHQRLETQAETVARPHPDRVVPPCPFTARCSGCVVQHIAPAAQRSAKRHHLALLLAAEGLAPPGTWLADVVGPGTGYRHKARLGVRRVPGLGGVLIGFREPGSSRVAELDACRVLAPAVGLRLGELCDLLEGLSVAAAIPQVEVACGEDASALVLRHLQPLDDADRARLLAWGAATGIHWYLQSAGPDSVERLISESADEGPRQAVGLDRLHYSLPEFGLRFAFHPQDFVQVNPAINRQMVARALELLAPGPDDRVLDLFCGIGNFTLPLARRARHVTGVEGSSMLVERALENAAANASTLSGCELDFRVADLYADGFDVASLPPADLLLLDPPRSGAENIVRGIEHLAPRRIVYVSCNPATLARDARLLAAGGYMLTHAGILDMFPHTAHVESMAVFAPTSG